MSYGLVQTIAPASAAVSRAEAKLWCKIDDDLTADDALIDSLVAAATNWVQDTLGRQLVTATWRLTLDRFPYWGQQWALGRICEADAFDYSAIRLPRPPLASVTGIIYVDSDGTSQTLATNVYAVDTARDPGRVAPAYAQFWPVTRWQPGAVQITYTAGYGVAANVPDGLKTAVKLLVAHWYRNREAVGTVGQEVALAVQALCQQYHTGEVA